MEEAAEAEVHCSSCDLAAKERAEGVPLGPIDDPAGSGLPEQVRINPAAAVVGAAGWMRKVKVGATEAPR